MFLQMLIKNVLESDFNYRILSFVVALIRSGTIFS